MKERTITSVVLLAIALVLVIFSGYIVYPIGLSVLAVVSVFEVARVMGAEKKLAMTIPAYLFAAGFPIAAFFINEDNVIYLLLGFAACMLVYLIWLMGVSIFSKGKDPFSHISEVFCSVLYVVISVTSLSILRYLDRETGVFSVVLVFVIAWVCDTSAFAVGVLFGKHKLIEDVSPKKTIEGSRGGIVFCVVSFVVFGIIMDVFFDRSANILFLAISAVAVSVVSQIGDLIMSVIKRHYGIKDYGKLFPGQGGMLDRFDSILAVALVMSAICMLAGIMNIQLL